MESPVPDSRVRTLNQAGIRQYGSFVLYWMIGQRRLRWNFALDQAIHHARSLGVPLVILEALRCDYPWAADRHHRFVLDGMRDHRAVTRERNVLYYPYVEPDKGAGKGLLEAMGRHAAVVVTDDMPHFFYPAMLGAAGRALAVRLEAVDSHGLLPVGQPDRDFTAAYHFRIHLHKVLLEHVGAAPQPDPLSESGLPDAGGLAAPGGALEEVFRGWPAATDALLEGREGLAGLPIDHRVAPVPFSGGPRAAADRLAWFLARGYPRYADARNDPDADVGSRLSPYLHWGHISAHEIFRAVVDREGWTTLRVNPDHRGKRRGWWGVSPQGESFLDQLVTWRELGFNEWLRGGSEIETFESLPEWAQATLGEHADDPRPHRYDLDAFDRAETHDPLWNAAQRELREEGTVHNYLRMLWGKKILEWSAHPRDALEIMLELNNRYAVDGRDPNSTSGIMWVLGRYDRGWPERAIYGKVRSMSSDSTRRKVSVDDYLARHSGQQSLV
jgi:deoxyribodipyrimidine photo-lyase